MVMKVGVKFGPRDKDFSYLDQLSSKPDFIELFVAQGCDFSNLVSYIDKDKYPIVIHCAHYEFGVNFANPAKEQVNKEATELAIKVADEFNSDKIIIHPEFIEDDGCSLETTIDFIKRHHDKRFLIENMPIHTIASRAFGGEVTVLKRIIDECQIGFILDFAHANEYALGKNIDFNRYISELLELRPTHFHASDTKLFLNDAGICDDYHLNIGDGDINYDYLKLISPTEGMVTLETPKNIEKQSFEIKYLQDQEEITSLESRAPEKQEVLAK